jgi:hypothetical protein
MAKNMKGITWKEDIERAMREIGRPATANELFEIIRKNRQLEGRHLTKHSRHGVRRILQNEYEMSFSNENDEFNKYGLILWTLKCK